MTVALPPHCKLTPSRPIHTGPLNLVVTGGRDYSLQSHDYEVLRAIRDKFGIALLIHGDCRGVDRECKQWAIDNGIPHHDEPAKWKFDGRLSAGPIRNLRMCRMAFAKGNGALVAFCGNKGTQDCVSKALQVGLMVIDARYYP